MTINIIKIIATLSLCLVLTGCSETEKTPIEITTANKDSYWSSAYTTDGVLENEANNVTEPEVAHGSGATIQSGTDKEIDVDISSLSATMAYAEVFAMTSYPDDYMGKTIKITGQFTTFQNADTTVFVVMIMDETACCVQGLEFVLEGDYKFPDDYPPVRDTITVVGTYSTYEEDGTSYIELQDAVMIENE